MLTKVRPVFTAVEEKSARWLQFHSNTLPTEDGCSVSRYISVTCSGLPPLDENSLYQEFMEQIDIHMDSDPDESYPSSDISTFFQLIDKIGEQQKARQAEMEKKTAEDTEMDDASVSFPFPMGRKTPLNSLTKCRR